MLAAEHIDEYIKIPEPWVSGRVDFALKVQGDSMIGAGILDGDIALVQRQPTAQDGDIVVALLDEEATLKRFERGPDAILLHAENPRYAPIVSRDVSILGRLVGILRTF